MILHVKPQCETTSDSFPSIQEAYNQLTTLHKQGLLDNASAILVHQGDYVLEKCLHFDKDFPVEIRPFENDKVTISGGMPLGGWKKNRCNGRTVWKTALPESVTEVPFLFVNGKMAQAARWSKQEYLRVEDKPAELFSVDANCDNFLVKKGDFNPKWYAPENIFIRMIHFWIEETLKFKSFDEKSVRITTASSMCFSSSKSSPVS